MGPSAPELLRLVRRYGLETTCFQTLEQGTLYWSDGGEGLVAFTDTGSAWVAAGAPLCPPERVSELADAFVAAARSRGRRACFFAVDASLPRLPRMKALAVGNQPVWDPTKWPEVLQHVRSLREQLRRARAKRVRVRRILPAELACGCETRRALERLTSAWLTTKELPPLTFLLDVQLFSHPEQRRTFVAEREGVPVGLLSAVPVPGRDGWLFEDILRSPDAPNGTTESLIDAAMQQCAAEGSHHVTMGLVPLSGPIPAWLKLGRALCTRYYDFDGLKRFREKLRPTAWEPVRLCYPSSQTAVASSWDVVAALTSGRPMAYALDALTYRFKRTLPADLQPAMLPAK